MNDIAPGDLVQIVRDCCGIYVGQTFFVARMMGASLHRCQTCGYKSEQALVYTGQPQNGFNACYVPLAWLKKFPPLAELGDVKQEDEIAA